jgi:hypothetical protein
MERTFLQRLMERMKAGSDAVPSVVPAVEERRRPNQADAAPPEGVPGNFFSFKFLLILKIGEVEYVGSPSYPMRDSSPAGVRWIVKTHERYAGNDMLRMEWKDDERHGIRGRTVEAPEDLLSVEGLVGDMRLRFERILPSGPNVVVYALYCPEKNIRVAYGFFRSELFGGQGGGLTPDLQNR